jgi:hypothetical protein
MERRMRSVYAEGYDGTREGEGFRELVEREVGNRRFSFLAEDGGFGGKEIPLLRRRRTAATGGRCLVGVRGGEAASTKGLPHSGGDLGAGSEPVYRLTLTAKRPWVGGGNVEVPSLSRNITAQLPPPAAHVDTGRISPMP